MKRILIVMTLALSLGGCATVNLLTKSVTNPVTTNDLYQIEAGADAVVQALVAYRRACLAGAADVNCRANIKAVQPYTREIPPYLVQLRVFVKNNDQLNAANTYNALTALLKQARTTATNLGVNIGETQ